MDAPAGWTVEDDGKALLRSLRFKDFSAAFAFLTRVALHAEKADHHPEFTSRWNRVDFRLTSHDAGGITERDVALAKAIDDYFQFGRVVAVISVLADKDAAGIVRALAGTVDQFVVTQSGSDRSVDMSYTSAADIYVGDVSSQVYEFLAKPRPCVFLNPHRIAWRDDPNFLHWHLGDVIEDPAELLPAIRAAGARHQLYREKQEALAAASLGDRSPGAAKRAADSILEFMSHA